MMIMMMMMMMMIVMVLMIIIIMTTTKETYVDNKLNANIVYFNFQSSKNDWTSPEVHGVL